MTKREMKINERNIKIRSFMNETADKIVVENFDEKFSYAYGLTSEMKMLAVSDKELYRKFKSILSYSKFDSLLIKRSDIKTIWKGRYIVLEKGGVFDIATYTFIKKSYFNKLHSLFNKKCFNHELLVDNETFGMNTSEYIQYQQAQKEIDSLNKSILNLLEEEGFVMDTYSDYEYTHYRNNSTGDVFYIKYIDIKNSKIVFNFNGVEENENIYNVYNKIYRLIGGNHE